MDTPNVIERDTYTGRWMLRMPKANKVAVWTARQLGNVLGESGVFFSVQRIDGREIMFRNRFRRADNGDLHVYSAEGGRVIIHPASRKLRIAVS